MCIRDRFCDSRLEPATPARQRLDKVQREIGTSDGEDQPWQACSGADVDHRAVVGEVGSDNRAIEDMSVPESRRLPWADQPMGDSRVPQECNVTLRQGDVLAEDVLGCTRCGGLSLIHI